VAISFMVKKVSATRDKRLARVHYVRRPEMETAEEKLSFLASHPMRALDFDEVQPDKMHNWVNLTSNDFQTLMPLASKATKAATTAGKERAIFKQLSLGVVTIDKHLNEMQYQLAHMFRGEPNPTIAFLCVSSSNPLAAMALNQVFDYCLLKMGNGGTQAVSRWVHDSAGNRQDNITDWALKQFTAHYKPPVRPEPVEGLEGVGGVAEASTGSARTVTGTAKGVGVGAAKPKKITKQAIFHYCYAVLHDPVYREKYAQNLKRDFPRIPLYGTSPADFWQWAAWGEALMALHIGYEAVAPFPLARTDTPDNKARAAGLPPKAILRADPAAGCITLDTETTLRGIPPEAWTYKLGNRCALDWVLDQYKEKKPKDPTIREKFDTYRFADYKEKVIDLLACVTTVSVETVRIVAAMKAAGR
jgi:predicted helicase